MYFQSKIEKAVHKDHKPKLAERLRDSFRKKRAKSKNRNNGPDTLSSEVSSLKDENNDEQLKTVDSCENSDINGLDSDVSRKDFQTSCVALHSIGC